MTKLKLSLTTVSSLILFSQIASAQAIPQGQGNAPADRPQDKVVQKVDKWTDQAKKLTEKWKGTLESGANEVRQRNREQICSAVQNRVGDRWQKYYDARMNRVENLEHGVLALQNRVEYFKGEGLDTSELEADMSTLGNLVSEYKSAYTDFLGELEGAKTIPCANYEGKFLPQLKEARDYWLVVRSKMQVISDFYKSDIRSDLQALRGQLVDQNSESEED